MKKNSLIALAKLFAAQAASQGVLVLAGASAQEACMIVCGAVVLLPLYSQQARTLYSQAFKM